MALNREEVRQQCLASYGKNVRLKHLQRCLPKRRFKKAVEIGCGPAWLLHNVDAEQKIGYDIGPIDVFDDITYVKRDVGNIKETSVDLLICSEVIEHLEQDQATLNNFGSFMSPGGLIFLTTINKNIKTDKSEQDRIRGHLRRYSKDLRVMMEQAGFRTLDFYPAKSPYYYRHKGDISNYLCEEDMKETAEDASAWIYFGMGEKQNE
jgi:hypothetical protein